VKTTNNTILITGGATGIGLSLAEVFLKAGNHVIICGRRREKLLEAHSRFPQLQIKVCDVASEKQRQALLNWAIINNPGLNILVNNAGIQRQIGLASGVDELMRGEDEIKINFSAPVYLSALFIPHLKKQPEAAIINVSSGLGFVPLTIVPVYCATKAAIHSFTVSLRHQLRRTSIKVFEIIPPTVDTDLDRGARADRRQEYRGIPPMEVAEAALAGIARDEFEIAVGQAQGLHSVISPQADAIFQRMNENW
jgi:uncharacterized oxidoreductase